MTRIIKTTQGTASFVQTEEFADEADAEVGEKPEVSKVNVNEVKIENIKWKQKQ
tara:strand:- start:2528 stop:2689 length:162 start_codon:yes stop_codon:yes gene_type:complete